MANLTEHSTVSPEPDTSKNTANSTNFTHVTLTVTNSTTSYFKTTTSISSTTSGIFNNGAYASSASTSSVALTDDPASGWKAATYTLICLCTILIAIIITAVYIWKKRVAKKPQQTKEGQGPNAPSVVDPISSNNRAGTNQPLPQKSEQHEDPYVRMSTCSNDAKKPFIGNDQRLSESYDIADSKQPRETRISYANVAASHGDYEKFVNRDDENCEPRHIYNTRSREIQNSVHEEVDNDDMYMNFEGGKGTIAKATFTNFTFEPEADGDDQISDGQSEEEDDDVYVVSPKLPC